MNERHLTETETETDSPVEFARSAQVEPRGKGGQEFRWSRLLFEFLSIVVGVLLALGVNEWREDRNNRSRARQALVNITREIEANQAHLTEVHRNNSAYLAAMDEVSEGDSSGPEFQAAWGLQSTAWEAARESGALGNVEYGTILSIAQVYQFQETYLDLMRRLFEAQTLALLLGEEADPQIALQAMGVKLEVHTRLMVQNEATLLDWYQRSLRYSPHASVKTSPNP
ncbi:MAG: hypothetical protein K0U98_25965 [Deltaproteobacteria bacterium]|nr:hypothetical protein [Deltaproteobacteria bacterium]